MPILIQEESWKQTLHQIIICLPLKNVSRKTVDVFSTPRYLKVSYPPYLYEKFLFAEIDDQNSCVELTSSQIVLKLLKSYPLTWENVAHVTSSERVVMQAIREEAVEFAAQRAVAETTARKAAKQESHNYAVAEHIESEAARRKKSANFLEEEKTSVLKEFVLADANAEEQEDPMEELLAAIAKVDKKRETVLSSKETTSLKKASEPEQIRKKVSNDEPAKIRSSAVVTFTATPRQFPTPQRESQVAEEEKWLQQQAGYRKVLTKYGIDDSSRPEERDPLWLKQKADSFLAACDYDSAVVCYSRALQLGCRMPEIVMNRGLANLLKGNLHKVLEDMETALAIYPDKLEVTRKERCKAYWRRALSFFKLELLLESLIEFDGAVKCAPDISELKKQRDFVQNIIQGTVDLGDQHEREFLKMLCGLVVEKS